MTELRCFLVIVLLLLLISSSTSHRFCGTSDLSPKEENDAIVAMDQWRARAKQRQQQLPTFQVDMYFHVIQSDDFQPPVSDDLLQEQFEILNRVFQGSGFQFKLKGITRTQRSEWVGNTFSNNALKTVIGLALRLGGGDTMNVYIQPGLCPDGTFGYASLPKRLGVYPVNKYSPNDHVTICNDYLPGRSAPFDLGYTLVHEVGHWLGVSHPFRNEDCSASNRNDLIEDTPQTSSPVYNCPTFRDSCPGRPGSDLVNNFMDYTDDRCMTAFTKGQLDRMGAQYNAIRRVRDSESCSDDQASIKFELHFDANDGQTQWGMVDWGIQRRTTFFKSDFIYDFSNQYAVYEDCIPTNALHEFYVENLMEGGLDFPGFAALTVNGREMLRTSQFASKRHSTFISAGPSDCGAKTRIYLTILFDGAPQEITWLLRDANTNEEVEDYTSSLFASAGVYDSRMAGSFLHIDRCLPNGKYDLSFKDSTGEGEGYWRVSNDFDDTLAYGSTNTSEAKSFNIGPTSSPSQAPSTVPSTAPTSHPSISASLSPSQNPSTSGRPSVSPSGNPSFSHSPTLVPTTFPSTVPSTDFPSGNPTLSLAPSQSIAPTSIPSTSLPPSQSVSPTLIPTGAPTRDPTAIPSQHPTLSSQPSVPPSVSPSELIPSSNPLNSEPTLGACFSGDTLVIVKEKGAMRLRDVQIGDMVMVGSGLYEAIYSFGHRSPNSVNMLLEIVTSALSPLQVSKDHMIFRYPHLAVPASMLREGDTIIDGNERSVLITSIKTVVADSGVFAPFTPCGKILVNGLLASSFIAFGDTAFLTLVGGIQFSYQWIAHSFEFPHRISCHHMAFCPNEIYTDSGISTWVAAPYAVAKWLLQQRRIIQLPLLILILTILAVFHGCACIISVVY